MYRILGFVSAVIFATLLAFPFGVAAVALPSARDISTNPGATEVIEIPIVNTSDTSATISFSMMSAEFSAHREQPEIVPLSADRQSWIVFSPSIMTLEAGESSFVSVSISPPATEPDQVFVLALVESRLLPGQISLSYGSATLIFVTIGAENARGSCVGISPLGEGVFENTGRGILVPNGHVVLRGVFGIRVAQSDVNPVRHRVLPGQTRTWNIGIPSVPWWAVGTIRAGIESENVATNTCDDLFLMHRWWPIMIAGICLGIFGIGCATSFRFKRS